MTVERYIEAFETLTPETLDRLIDCFAEDARFEDPFNAVAGKAAIRAVFEKMFEDAHAPAFTVLEHRGEGAERLLRWRFTATPRGLLGRRGPLAIEGASAIRLAEDGRVEFHRDYWDPTPLYARIPLLGAALRWIRGRVAAG